MTDATLSPFGEAPAAFTSSPRADLMRHATCEQQLEILNAARRLFAFQHPVLSERAQP